MTDQPEALRVAHWLERDGRVNCYEHPLMDAARLLREQHAEIEELREFHQDVRDEKIDMLEEEIERLTKALAHQRDIAHLMLQRAEKAGQQRDRMRAALARIAETEVFVGAIAGQMMGDALREGLE